MLKSESHAQTLLQFINASPTAYHAVRTTSAILESAGFTRLDERAAWKLSGGDRRYLVRQDASIVAFVVGDAPPEDAGFLLAGAHTDSPHPRIKPKPDMVRQGFMQLGVEPYGGMLLSTWMDRDLSLAGRVLVAGSTLHEVSSLLVDFKRPILRIPNLAIHLDREVNTKGVVINPQQHLAPVLGLDPLVPENRRNLVALVAEQLSCDYSQEISADQVLDFDLSLYDTQKAELGGLRNEFIFAARLDNLASCEAALRGLIQSLAAAPFHASTRLVAFWNHEECGNRSASGAMGPLIRQTIDRIVEARSSGTHASCRALANSFLISADMAHSIHPNYVDRHEPAHAPAIGVGPVIKYNSNQSYATDGASAARFVSLCRVVGFEPQRFVTRSDLPCGSTIGPATAALTGVQTVDVGNPMLSMHSIREMAGVEDHAKMVAVLKTFFESQIAT